MKIRQLFISPGHNYFGQHQQPAGSHPAMEVAAVECVAGRGIRGDRFFDFKDNYKGQITFFSQEIFEAMCAELKLSDKSPGLSRRNVIVAGASLNDLVGQEFQIQDLKFMGTAECSPCYWMDQAFAPRRGTFSATAGRTARPDFDGWHPARESVSFSAVILAGGRSSRMGCDKAFLEIGTETLLARQIKTVRAAGAAEVFISGRGDVDYSASGLRVVHDLFPDAGPLAGIHAALGIVATARLLVLAVDLPAMNPVFLQQLLTAATDGMGVIPRIAGNIEPLVALYPRSAHEIAGTLLRENNFAVRNFARTCVAANLAIFKDFPADCATWFKNMNSPADLPQANGLML